MIPEVLALSALSLILIGIFGIVIGKPLFKILLAYKVLEIGAVLFVLSLSGVGRGGQAQVRFSAPMLETMAAVFIVLSLGFTALVLALVIRWSRNSGGPHGEDSS